jgi:hypothetical protein
MVVQARHVHLSEGSVMIFTWLLPLELLLSTVANAVLVFALFV